MAPALVEPSSVPKSSSVLNRSSQLPVSHCDLVLNFPLPSSCLFDEGIAPCVAQRVEPVSYCDNSGGQFLQPQTSTQIFPLSMNDTFNDLEMSENFEIAKHREFIARSRNSFPLGKELIKTEAKSLSSKSLPFPCSTSCDVSHRHPVAITSSKSSMESTVVKRRFRSYEKLKELNKRLYSCTARVKSLQACGLSLGVASQLSEDTEKLGNASSVVSNNVLPETLQGSVISSTKSIATGIVLDSAIVSKVKHGLGTGSFGEVYEKLHNSACSLEAGLPDTDSEDDFESPVRLPLYRGKKKYEKPAPPVDLLMKWKCARASIGSQCSWLHEKIAELDKQVSVYSKLQQSINAFRPKLELQHQLSASNLQQSKEQKQIMGEKANGTCYSSITLATPLGSSLALRSGAARVCPVQQLPKHKYLLSEKNREMLNCHLGREAQFAGYACRNMPAIVPCRLCQHSASARSPVNLVAARLDHSYHANLSSMRDVSLSVQLERFLRKENTCTNANVSNAFSKRIKKRYVPSSDASRSESQEKDATGKRGRDKSRKGPRKRSGSLDFFAGRSKQLKISDACESPKPSMSVSGTSSPVLSQSLPSGSGQLQSFKRKKGSNTHYDINNIVIPYSMASSTRVERIQYKEIPTPGWRPLSPIFGQSSSGEVEQELTDDEVFVERHAVCEVEERKRFTTFFQPARKTRPVRTSECVGSEPASPMPSDDVPIFKSTTATPTDSPGLTPTGTARPFTRQVSQNLPALLEDDRDAFWSRRRFPLSEFESRRLQSSELKTMVRSRSTTSIHLLGGNSQTEHLFKSPLPSPLQTPSAVSSPSSPISSPVSDDGWTVKLLTDNPSIQQAEKPRKGIVLKLAKR